MKLEMKCRTDIRSGEITQVSYSIAQETTIRNCMQSKMFRMLDKKLLIHGHRLPIWFAVPQKRHGQIVRLFADDIFKFFRVNKNVDLLRNKGIGAKS